MPTIPDPPRTPPGNYFAVLPLRVPEGWMEPLKVAAPAALRWFHPDDLHLTLAFFGREDPDRVPALLELLREIPYPLAAATPGRLIALPRPRRFSALACELNRGCETITAVIAGWRDRLLDSGGRERPDTRSYVSRQNWPKYRINPKKTGYLGSFPSIVLTYPVS